MCQELIAGDGHSSIPPAGASIAKNPPPPSSIINPEILHPLNNAAGEPPVRGRDCLYLISTPRGVRFDAPCPAGNQLNNNAKGRRRMPHTNYSRRPWEPTDGLDKPPEKHRVHQRRTGDGLGPPQNRQWLNFG
ncbi:hypothetical protein EVAR_88689_1 [Eumeta japonica]|uniref:Uncharacterized protein n=1 Tax=Eumeta variegata TaxID=151549 RepID=A0A4C1Y2I3_EUMVA|nr:hypothetical protein EVAR_88689_1 [Eumeta japonica]